MILNHHLHQNQKNKIEEIEDESAIITQTIEIKEIEIPKSLNEDKKFLKEKIDEEENEISEKILKEISEKLKECKGQLEEEMNEIKKT